MKLNFVRRTQLKSRNHTMQDNSPPRKNKDFGYVLEFLITNIEKYFPHNLSCKHTVNKHPLINKVCCTSINNSVLNWATNCECYLSYMVTSFCDNQYNMCHN